MMFFPRVIYLMFLCCVIKSTVATELPRSKYTLEALVGFRTLQAGARSSIINTTFITGSLIQCSSVCMQKRSCSLYYTEVNGSCHCNHGADNSSDSDDADAVIYGEVDYMSEVLSQLDVLSYPRDCAEHYESGHLRDGIYVIHPIGGVKTITWCDMTNGGWTVIQRRQDGLENFLRNWADYVNGFGNKCGEYWLGLDSINLLTTEPSELHIYLETFADISPTSAYARYSTFSVGNSGTNYKLSIGGFEGSCGDALAFQNGRQFTTIDADNDLDQSGNCAVTFQGAWWYSRCHRSNLNGLYLQGNHSTFADGINWVPCWNFYYSLKKTVMKIRRL